MFLRRANAPTRALGTLLVDSTEMINASSLSFMVCKHRARSPETPLCTYLCSCFGSLRALFLPLTAGAEVGAYVAQPHNPPHALEVS